MTSFAKKHVLEWGVFTIMFCVKLFWIRVWSQSRLPKFYCKNIRMKFFKFSIFLQIFGNRIKRKIFVTFFLFVCSIGEWRGEQIMTDFFECATKLCEDENIILRRTFSWPQPTGAFLSLVTLFFSFTLAAASSIDPWLCLMAIESVFATRPLN